VSRALERAVGDDSRKHQDSDGTRKRRDNPARSSVGCGTCYQEEDDEYCDTVRRLDRELRTAALGVPFRTPETARALLISPVLPLVQFFKQVPVAAPAHEGPIRDADLLRRLLPGVVALVV
jgi:hypothetical protein